MESRRCRVDDGEQMMENWWWWSMDDGEWMMENRWWSVDDGEEIWGTDDYKWLLKSGWWRLGDGEQMLENGWWRAVDGSKWMRVDDGEQMMVNRWWWGVDGLRRESDGIGNGWLILSLWPSIGDLISLFNSFYVLFGNVDESFLEWRSYQCENAMLGSRHGRLATSADHTAAQVVLDGDRPGCTQRNRSCHPHTEHADQNDWILSKQVNNI